MKPVFIVNNIINSNSKDENELIRIFNEKWLKIILYLEYESIKDI
ncbi:MAG: hypothetical protein PHU94_04995 [Bacilli bacterium]|nr:hypothetical protein [Bacilli bacterium]MDD4407210.1 hypothetical protein [Bacilli bacterium]